ncbi:hypothetical protein [Halomonas alimentaria]|uniref:hypothetical protein n=1 Tax=Halomonas alimentaria TaxID=147248 RepID=UPI0024916B8C|nr:hypothetical protein [Halomonas alimentaria]
MSKPEVIRWVDSHSDATIENEPRVEIEVIEPIMVGGKTALKGQRVNNVPQHMAIGLKDRGRAKLVTT